MPRDDLAPNVATARALGINAYQVEGLAAVVSTLKEEGLLAEGIAS